jgi:hypothetical protein
MDQQTDEQEPSSTEAGEMKKGDKVWVRATVTHNSESSEYMELDHNGYEIIAHKSDCRPVEPEQDGNPVEFKVGDRVVSWSGREGVVEAINEIEGFPITVRHSMREQASYKLGGVKHDHRPVEPANSPKILDSSSEPMREAFEAEMVKRYGEERASFARNENRYFDSSMEIAWQAFQAGAKYQASPLAPSPCMDGVDADRFVDSIMEARGRASDPLQVGDAVRFVSPGHKRHGTEGILKSIHHGPKNAYLFISDCGQFHRYCAIAELEHYEKAGAVDVKGSMASLDGADTIQAGDLQWTDRDGKYRLCNFTIGLRAHEAIQRGKAHGEKWVFYRKFEEVGE